MSVSSETTTSGTYTGRVKWFNKRAGYGFITHTEGDMSGKESFVYYKDIDTDNQDLYRYLVDGEYVSFELVECPESETHTVKATKVRGVNGGKLMCETIKERRDNRAKETPRGKPFSSRGGGTSGVRGGSRSRRVGGLVVNTTETGETVLLRRVVSYVPVNSGRVVRSRGGGSRTGSSSHTDKQE